MVDRLTVRETYEQTHEGTFLVNELYKENKLKGFRGECCERGQARKEMGSKMMGTRCGASVLKKYIRIAEIIAFAGRSKK